MSSVRSRNQGAVLAVLAVLAVCHRPAAAQTARPVWQPEVSGAIGLGHVFRFQDRSYGDEPNVSGGFLLRHRSGFGVEVETNRTFGLTARPAPCGILSGGQPVTCTGSARDGVLAASSLSFNVHYVLTGARVQPYLLGGLGVQRTRVVSSITTVNGPTATQTEEEDSSTGIGPDVGAGLRIPIGGHLTVAPEVRWLEAASLSRHNLAVTRASVRLAWVF